MFSPNSSHKFTCLSLASKYRIYWQQLLYEKSNRAKYNRIIHTICGYTFTEQNSPIGKGLFNYYIMHHKEEGFQMGKQLFSKKNIKYNVLLLMRKILKEYTTLSRGRRTMRGTPRRGDTLHGNMFSCIVIFWIK